MVYLLRFVMHSMDLEVPLLHIRTPIGKRWQESVIYLRLAVNGNQNDTYVKDQAIDSVQA